MNSAVPFSRGEARRELYDLLRSDQSFEETARAALELGKLYLGADNGHLTRIDRDTGHWESVVSTDGLTGEYAEGLELDLETTYCRETLSVDDSLALTDAPNEGWTDHPAFDRHGIHCYHGTTLLVDGEQYGTVCFVATDSRAQFADDERQFAELVAHTLGRELERLRHETQLGRQTNLAVVLNRALRHNIQNGLSVVRGYTHLVDEKLADEEKTSRRALKRIDELLELGEKARRLDHVITTAQERESADIVALVRDCVQSVERAYPDASFSVEADREIRASILPSFAHAIEELIENAAGHGGDSTTVTVHIDPVPNATEIRITDDGSGLSRAEMDVLETERGEPPTNGSGLGLWLARWIVASHDGTISSGHNEDGTTLVVSVPQVTAGVLRETSGPVRVRDEYKASFEEAGDGMTITDDSARILDVNEEAARIYGEDREALLGRSMQEFLPADFDFEAEWGEIQASEMRREELEIVSSDGGVSPIEYTAKTNVVPGQHLIVSRDIAEQKRREQRLRETTERLETVVDLCPEPVVALDVGGAIELWNDAAAETFGFDSETALGKRIHALDLFDTVEGADFEDWIERVLAGETIRDFSIDGYERDGTTVDLRLSAAPLRDDTELIVGLVAVLTDVTDIEAQRRELERTLEQYRIVAENVPDGGVFRFDSELCVQFAAGDRLATLGIDPADFDGTKLEHALDVDFPPALTELCRATLDGESRQEELHLSGRTYRIQTVPLRNADATVYAGLATTRDITEKKEIERFASVISHDLRNPLNVAIGQLELAAQEHDGTHMDAVAHAHERMEALTEDVLTLSQSQDTVTELESVDLAETMADCWDNVDTGDATFTNSATGTIRADATRLKRVLENLFDNAGEHGGDDVAVTVGNRDDGFYVEDTGPGIPESDRQRVFEDGHSSKTDGTGLGLSIVERGIDCHGWTIRVEAGSSDGARFVVGGVEYEGE